MPARFDHCSTTIGAPSASVGPSNRGLGRALASAILLVTALVQFTGCSLCSCCRLPAIDSTGRCIFNPLPATTTLAIPGTADNSKCFHGLFSHGSKPFGLHKFGLHKFGHTKKHCSLFPKPIAAFTEPATPPKCVPPATAAPATQPLSIRGADEPCVPSAPCTTDCKDGPPAVLIGDECNTGERCGLPKRGKRGGILLSPQKIVAPVGGEVVLLSGICGTEGYLEVGEPLEWMLTPESVGTFIQVGDDDPGLLHKLARVKTSSKKDPSYAHGVTSTKRVKITRGNLDPKDDVQLEKGQTWITISSPSEGTSKVTVLAPESECWDQRKATATIYWVDAARQFPGTQIVPAGTPVNLTTRVTRSEGTLPARGWKVQYEILQPELGSFAGTNGSSFVESVVDDSGNATVQLIPTPGTSGTATISMKVIRPGGDSDNMPSLTLFTGQTFVTWSAPQLRIRAAAPQVASFGVPFRAVANVSNPGDQAATNVRVVLQVPQGVAASSTDSFATNTPNAVIWEIGQIPPRSELDLFADITTESSLPLTFEARADGGLVATDVVTVDIYRPSIVLSVSPERDRYEVGERVTFNIDVRNTGDRPLSNLQLVANGNASMLHSPSNNPRVVKLKQNPDTQEDIPLQPGQTWQVAVTYLPTDAGQRCIQVEATADAGQRGTSQACVIVTNKPVPTPSVTATLTGRARISVGNNTLFRGVVVNNGQVPLEEVRVTMVYQPQLRPLGATDQFLTPPRPGQNLIEWVIPRLEPETSLTLEGEFQAVSTSPRSSVTIAVDSRQGAKAGQRFEFEILRSAVQPSAPAPAPPINLPPPSAPPMIPPPAPIPGPATPLPPSTTPPAAPIQPAEPEALGLLLTGPTTAVPEKQPIRYSLRVTNPSSRPDDNVSIKFNLPDGVDVTRVSQTLSPELGGFLRNGDQIYLKDIGSMRPGESIDYIIVLSSNRPQTFTITAEAVSRGKRLGARSQVTTQVVSAR
jgi:hypothetical protein